MPQGMVELNDGTLVPLGAQPQTTITSQPQPQPNRFDPRTFVQQEFKTQFNALREVASRQWEIINKNRRTMGAEKAQAMNLKLNFDFQKQTEDLFKASQQKISLMGNIEALISQGALNDEQTGLAQNLIARTAMGNDLGNRVSPPPEKGMKADPLSAFNTLQSIIDKTQRSSDRFRVEETEEKVGGFLGIGGHDVDVSTLSQREGPFKEDFVDVTKTVYDPKLKTVKITGDTGALSDFNSFQFDLIKLRKMKAKQRDRLLTKVEETFAETFGKQASGPQGATIGERVGASAMADNNKKRREILKNSKAEYLRRRTAGMSQEEAANGLELGQGS